MAQTSALRRESLRERLLDVAEAQIAEGGIVALTARDLAAEAGCSLGAIYSAYGDLGSLAVAVNRRTIAQMTEFMAEAADGLAKAAPNEVLTALALAYLDYAEAAAPRWRTLFSVGLPESDTGEPDFAAEAEPLIGMFATQLALMHPDRGPGKTDTAARSLFAAIHGLVGLSLEPRIAVVPRQKLENRIARLVDCIAARQDNL